MATLTKQEKKWFDKLQKVLDECPFNGRKFDSYTTGDDDVTVFKLSNGLNDYICKNEVDIYKAVNKFDAEVCILQFPFKIASAAG